ncbi:MAG: nitrous oxide reductase family maturation protein NosD [Rhodospirillales bacterium]|nr:nitrous oxide reductase family maturation protein NosD [Rhodospirillales bacterium]
MAGSGARWISAFAGMTVLLAAADPAIAAEVSVRAGNLAAALAAARPGDHLILEPGIHEGPIDIDRTITLSGRPGAVVDGGRRGNVIRVSAPEVVIRDLEIRNSGHSLERMDSGVFIGKAGDGAVVENNRIIGNLFGVYVWGPENAVVGNNLISGLTELRVNERGNGVSLWNAPGSRIEGNVIEFGRDGIFTTTSKRNAFTGNRFSNLRFAVHYMYTNESVVSGNVSTGNNAGYVLMFSDRLRVEGNHSSGDRDHGIALNYANSSTILGNAVEGGSTKCVFIYNSNKNEFRRNHFEGCEIGIHFTAGSERNVFSANAFIGNETQVKYVGTRHLDWSDGGTGNYWSDNPAFDLNGDGIADAPYRPNDLVDQVVWRVPAAKLLLNSPAVQVVRWAQTQFPSLLPGGVIDSAPLMKPPGNQRRAAR